jgi:hypothetical protein
MSYCILDPSEVRRLELEEVRPNCKNHLHLSNAEGERGVRDGTHRQVGWRGKWLTRVPHRVWATGTSAGVRMMQMRDCFGSSARHFHSTGRRILNQAHTRCGPVRAVRTENAKAIACAG